MPREIEIWFVIHRDRFYLFSETGEAAAWVKNIRRNPEVVVRIEARRVSATARVLDRETDRELWEQVAAIAERKYGWGDGLPVEITPFMSARPIRPHFQASRQSLSWPREASMKPYVICHMVASVDGRVLTGRWRPEDQRRAYFEQLHDRLGVDAWPVGHVTGEEYAKRDKYPDLAGQRYPTDLVRPTRCGGVWHRLRRTGQDRLGAVDISDGDPIVVVLTEMVTMPTSPD